MITQRFYSNTRQGRRHPLRSTGTPSITNMGPQDRLQNLTLPLWTRQPQGDLPSHRPVRSEQTPIPLDHNIPPWKWVHSGEFCSYEPAPLNQGFAGTQPISSFSAHNAKGHSWGRVQPSELKSIFSGLEGRRDSLGVPCPTQVSLGSVSVSSCICSKVRSRVLG